MSKETGLPERERETARFRHTVVVRPQKCGVVVSGHQHSFCAKRLSVQYLCVIVLVMAIPSLV